MWQRQNPGLAKRIQKHDATFSSKDPDGESTRKAAMERKAKMYEMLERGGDVPDRLREELLVEFEYKHRREHSRERDRKGYDSSESDSDDGNVSRKVFRGRRRDRESRRRSRSRSGSSDWDKNESIASARDPKDFTVCNYFIDPFLPHIHVRNPCTLADN